MTDEFQGNIWWRPADGPLGGLRSATPGECAQEIQRLRGMLDHLGMLAENDHKQLQNEIDRLRGILTTIFDAEKRAAVRVIR